MKVRSKFSRKIFALGLILFLGSGLVLGAHAISTKFSAQALSARDFNPGRIMDDSVFYNKDAMSISQIQSFLNTLIPWCNTWNPQKFTDASGALVGAPYVCLNNYHENPTTGETSFEKGGGAFSGGHSAAKIIYDAGQKYNINPQVLLVMLKKESLGPITSDNWPTKWQYRYSMGYGCPDSGPDFTAACNEKQAGFYKQVNLAAWQFDYYRKNPNSYRYKIGWNDIQYSPNPACGTKRVNIENIATLSLYIYTPYVPNDAALANYPGTSHCGAYGNRNFFMFFREWFGSTFHNTPSFSPMDLPRQLYTKSETIKIDPANGQKTEDLPAGLLINFEQKISYGGKVCLRTETDTRSNKQMCVLEENLNEVFSNMISPRKLYTKSETIKIDPANGQKTEDLPAGLEIEFSQLANYSNNDVCLRTQTDRRLNKRMCVSYDNLHETNEVFSPMDAPRQLKARRDAYKVNPITLEAIPGQFVIKGQVVSFYSRSTAKDGKLCLRTELNSVDDNNMCLLYDDLAEMNEDITENTSYFSEMDKPRKLKLARNTTKIDAITKERYDPLPKDMIVDFQMRSTVNGELCLRTVTDTKLGKNSCVLYNDLQEIN